MAFELHEDAEVQGLADLIDPRSSDERRFIILSGKPGGGRSSLLAAAVRRVREGGQPVLFSRLDFDGFEPDVLSPQDYVAYLFSKRPDGAYDDAAIALAARLAASSPFSAEQVALLAAVAGRDADSEDLVPLSDAALDSDGVHWDRLVVDPLAAPVVLHLSDSAQLPVLLRLALLHQEVPGLIVVISCDPSHSSESVMRNNDAARFELMSMDEGEVRFWLRDRIGEAAAGHAPTLYSACGGSRELLNRVVSNSTDQEDWSDSLPPSQALEQLISTCDEDRRQTLQAFLVHAALCGQNIPVGSILDYLGVKADDLDDWTDLIDETVGDDSEVALFGSRFQHPSFVGEIVYGFRDSASRERLRLALPEESRHRMAQQFAAWLFRHRPVITRAAARLMIELCLEGGIDGDRAAIERELAWWAGDADLDALRVLLVSESKPVDQIWVAVNAVQTLWPPQRTLALLDAAKELGVAPQTEGALYAIRAGLFLRLQRFEDAAESVEVALNHVDGDPLLETVLLEQRGGARRALKRESESFADFERCRALRLELLASGDARVVTLLQRSLQLLREASRTEEAAVVEKALAEHARQSDG